MKTFNDLIFKERYNFGKQAILYFDNGYGASVICGRQFHSNGKNTYEVAILYKGDVCYPSEIVDEWKVFKYQTADQVTDIMEQVQQLDNPDNN